MTRLQRMLTGAAGHIPRPSGLRVALVGVLAAAIWVVGSHGHSHADGGLRVLDADGNTLADSEWRLGGGGDGRQLTVTAGSLRFELSNSDVVAHDFVIARAPGGRGGAAEDGQTSIPDTTGEVVAYITAVPPGSSSGRLVELAPGRYVLFCNTGGHAEHGMHYTLVVE